MALHRSRVAYLCFFAGLIFSFTGLISIRSLSEFLPYSSSFLFLLATIYVAFVGTKATLSVNLFTQKRKAFFLLAFPSFFCAAFLISAPQRYGFLLQGFAGSGIQPKTILDLLIFFFCFHGFLVAWANSEKLKKHYFPKVFFLFTHALLIYYFLPHHIIDIFAQPPQWIKDIVFGVLLAAGILISLSVTTKNKSAAFIRSINGPLFGRHFPLTKEVTYLGSADTDDINLNNYLNVHPEHAKLVKYSAPNAYFFVNNVYRTSTMVNYRKSNEQVLEHGDVLAIGQAKFQFFLTQS